MPLEIERKFLLRTDDWRAQTEGSVRMAQGYLNTDPNRTVRVRLAGDRAFLTVKGPVSGVTRAEFEYPVPPADATGLLALCARPLVEKTRHYVRHGGLLWEIDEFTGANAGLILAEVELTSEQQDVPLPDWIGAEVSGQKRYYNSNLITTPYGEWGG